VSRLSGCRDAWHHENRHSDTTMSTTETSPCTCPTVDRSELRRVVRDGAITVGIVRLRLGVGCERCGPELSREIARLSRAA
jgi:bacterioferritin-associated ferredoxin